MRMRRVSQESVEQSYLRINKTRLFRYPVIHSKRDILEDQGIAFSFPFVK